MTKEETISSLREALDSVDITFPYRCAIVNAIEYLSIQELEGLDEAAEKYLDTQDVAEMFCGDYEGWQIIDAFKAGVEWAMDQGVKTTGTISPRGIIYDTNVGYHLFLERYHNGDKVEIQIRKIKENGK